MEMEHWVKMGQIEFLTIKNEAVLPSQIALF